jgi:hypothetical protein
VFELLEARGVLIEPGLAAHELGRAEKRFGFMFPPDLAELLREGLPAGEGFPRWRDLDAALESQFAWPLEGLLFDVEYNAFWVPEWGDRPPDLESAKSVASEALRTAPALVPIYGHRYLPVEPLESGDPVFSIYQTDIIYYGHDLESYFEAEVGAGYGQAIRFDAIRSIRFWGRLVELNR